jgi:putative nucleotidyltransferase with HDIG domain
MPHLAAATPTTEQFSWTDWVHSRAWQDHADAIPMLPSLAVEVAEIALDTNVPATRITAIVSKDPVLATKVIQLANSAFSAPATEITSIREAVVRMGTTTVRNVVMTSCLTSMMENPDIYGPRGRALIDHSIGTAYLARLVAERCSGDADEMFLAGLLHDIGKLVILKLAAARQPGVAKPTVAEVEQVLEDQHAAFGGFLLRRWQLPRNLHDPIVWHHYPEGASNRPQEAAMIYVANRLAHKYGFGCKREEIDVAADPYFAHVNVDAATMKRFDERAPGLFEIARKITQ